MSENECKQLIRWLFMMCFIAFVGILISFDIEEIKDILTTQTEVAQEPVWCKAEPNTTIYEVSGIVETVITGALLRDSVASLTDSGWVRFELVTPEVDHYTVQHHFWSDKDSMWCHEKLYIDKE